MRNPNEIQDSIVRTTFEAPRSMVEEFRQIAKAHERTLSAEIRRLIAAEIERFRRERDAA
jgi:hypothetical protein